MSDKKKYIKIKGANEHNLKNIDIEIPRDEFTVVTGLSGSGKSSLAFDTIYAEGQRRYMESLSSYARQFLGQMEKPQVESIEGLPPAISIDQKSTNRNPRSTVGTVTEIYDYMRLLYARAGVPHCPKCGKEIKKQSVDEIVDRILELPERTKFQILAPIVRGKKGRHEKVFESAKKSGYVRVIVDGNMYQLTEEITLDKNIKHNIEIVVDRLSIREGIEKRLTDSIENALKLGNGLMNLDVIGGETITFSQNFACTDCGISIDEIQPRSFSFNNPFGACPDCYGLGYKMEFDVDLMIPNQSLSINQGAIVVLGWQSANDKKSFTNAILQALQDDKYPEITDVVKNYLNAFLIEDDAKRAEIIAQYVGNLYDINSVKQRTYVSEYSDVECYTKKGPYDDTYVVYAYYQMGLKNIDTTVPAISRLYVVRDKKTGNVYIQNDSGDDIQKYMNKVTKDSDVQDLLKDVQEEFESVKASDPKVKAYYDAINAKANEKKNETTTGTSNNKNETTASHTSNNATTKASVTTQAPTTKVNSTTKPQTTASKNNKNK